MCVSSVKMLADRSASDFSSLIIEYVQRFDDFDGFFTKENVASLTYAAGQEENVSKEL